jgi:hypothetical protein
MEQWEIDEAKAEILADEERIKEKNDDVIR